MSYEKVTSGYNWRKIVLRLIIYLAIAYFIIGYILVIFKLFDQNSYLLFSGIVGGIASVAGLLTFLSNRINKDDVEKIGVEYFKQVVDAQINCMKKKKFFLIKKSNLVQKKES